VGVGLKFCCQFLLRLVTQLAPEYLARSTLRDSLNNLHTSPQKLMLRNLALCPLVHMLPERGLFHLRLHARRRSMNDICSGQLGTFRMIVNPDDGHVCDIRMRQQEALQLSRWNCTFRSQITNHKSKNQQPNGNGSDGP